MVICLIGLSGAGKTTVAKALASKLRENHNNVVFLDGDVVREIIGNGLGYSVDERRKVAELYCRMCNWLEAEGSIVVCATISMFPELRKWSRENFNQYFEVFIDVPLQVIVKSRDNKGLYSKRRKGEITDIVGIDIPYPVPQDPDLLLDNSPLATNFNHFADHIITNIRNQIDFDII